VALSEKHRSSIYRSLVPVLGEEEAEALMHEFPGTERDELVTRSMLRAELADLRLELRTEISELRAEMRGGFQRQTAWLATVTIAAVAAAAAFG
jgi:hypothetical protein